MKLVVQSTVALVAALTLTTANAATNGSNATAAKTASTKTAKHKVAKTKAAKATEKTAALKATGAKAKAADVSAVSSDVQTTQTAKLSDIKPIVEAKKWSLGLDSDNYANLGAANTKSGDIESDYKVQGGYKIADNATAALALEWSTMNGVNGQKPSQTFEDPSIRLAGSDLADLGMGVGLSGQARLYLPVSEKSQAKEQLAQIRLYATASREITKALTASFTLNPRIYVQQQDTFNWHKGDGTPSVENVEQFKLLSIAGLKYAINDRVAVEQTLGIYPQWKTNTDRADYLWAESTVYINVAKWLDLATGVRQSDSVTNTRKAPGLSHLYNSAEAEYFLTASLSM